MSNGKNRLMLMMALTMPGAAEAIGLGDIHVESALNERLAAEIDIVGATAEELQDLQAAVANRETFLHFGADRPAFLSTATFKVTENGRGRPVLAVRSSDAFTEPLVDFLVDLRWHNGELVRHYTLLLDPPGFAAPLPAVEAKPPTLVQPIDPPLQAKTANRAARKMTQIKVGAKATLRGVAWRVGERTEPQLQRMMIAIFRANPSAFHGNINRLQRGAVLAIPSAADVATIAPAEARHEFHAQMAAWRGARPTGATPAASIPASASAAAAAPSAAPMRGNDSALLDRRVQSLEQELSDVKIVLDRERDQLLELRQRAERAAKDVPNADTARVSDASPALGESQAEAQEAPPHSGSTFLPVALGLGGLAGALAALYFRLKRRSPAPKVTIIDGEAAASRPAPAMDATALYALADIAQPLAPATPATASAAPTPEGAVPAAARSDYATHPMLPIIPSAGRSEMTGDTTVARAALQEVTVKLPVDNANLRMDPTRLDYNLLDLDLTAQHVQMPSVLNEHAVVKERRTNLADVLKLAIERQPDRHDLRMKLLELYYSAASTNRKAFLEVVQKFARDRDYLNADQWDKIAFMGRQIASDDPLFVETAPDDDLADCA